MDVKEIRCDVRDATIERAMDLRAVYIPHP